MALFDRRTLKLLLFVAYNVLLQQGISHQCLNSVECHGPLARYVKLRVVHAPGMQGTFFPPPRVSDPEMHHGTCVTHVPWCMPGSLTSGFLLCLWRGKRSRQSRCMRKPRFYVSGKRSIVLDPLYDITASDTTESDCARPTAGSVLTAKWKNITHIFTIFWDLIHDVSHLWSERGQ